VAKVRKQCGMTLFHTTWMIQCCGGGIIMLSSLTWCCHSSIQYLLLLVYVILFGSRNMLELIHLLSITEWEDELIPW